LLSHVKESLQQDAEKIAALMPDVTVGIYSAGLGRKEAGYQVTVAGIQSAYKRAAEMGDVSIAIVDEAHLVAKTDDTMYRSFLSEMRSRNPHLKIVGMSATPYRLDSGPLTKGDNRIFTDVCYSVTIKELIDLGYLAPLTTAPTRYRVNTANVKKRGGEYVTGDLERVVNQDGITDAALMEVDELCRDRRSWLVFCVGVDHARDVAQAIRMRGHRCEIVVGDTPKKVRAERLEGFKRGEIRALASVGVITTGFDAPCADALICLRPTLSPGLFVQMVGRVSRLHPGKADGLVLDFTDNIHRHGPVDLIEVDGDGNVRTRPYRDCPKCRKKVRPGAPRCECGHSFQKECKKCRSLCDMDLKVCPDCGEFFGMDRSAAHGTTAHSGGILSDQGSVTVKPVEELDCRRHKKDGRPDSVKVTYYTDRISFEKYSEWLCFDHGGYASERARQRWGQLGGQDPAPVSVDEALERIAELRAPDCISVKRDGKYWRVL